MEEKESPFDGVTGVAPEMLDEIKGKYQVAEFHARRDNYEKAVCEFYLEMLGSRYKRIEQTGDATYTTQEATALSLMRFLLPEKGSRIIIENDPAVGVIKFAREEIMGV